MLLRSDFHTETWRRLHDQIKVRITELHEQLESTSLNETTTATLRGRIAELRFLAARENEPLDVERAGDRTELFPFDPFPPTT